MYTRMVGPLLGLLIIVTLLIHAFAQPAAAAYRGSEENRNACIPDVFRLCSKLIPDATQITICLQQRSPLSHSGMSGRVYEPVPTVSAIARGAAHFRSAKFGGKVVSNAAGSRHRRDQHELQSE